MLSPDATLHQPPIWVLKHVRGLFSPFHSTATAPIEMIGRVALAAILLVAGVLTAVCIPLGWFDARRERLATPPPTAPALPPDIGQALAEQPLDQARLDLIRSHLDEKRDEQARLLHLWATSHLNRLVDGETEVSDNGDCLFEAFTCLSQIAQSTAIDAETERTLTVDWMEARVTDRELRPCLVQSLLESQLAKIEQLEAEMVNLRALRQSTTDQEAEQGELEAMIPGIIGGEINALLPNYFAKMRQKGTFGGRAELHALSCRHEVSVWIYTKEGTTVSAEPTEKINPDFTAKPHRCMIFHRNHYNPYTPATRS